MARKICLDTAARCIRELPDISKLAVHHWNSKTAGWLSQDLRMTNMYQHTNYESYIFVGIVTGPMVPHVVGIDTCCIRDIGDGLQDLTSLSESCHFCVTVWSGCQVFTK